MKILIIVAKIKSRKSSIVFKYNKHINYCYQVNSKQDLNTIKFYVLVYFKFVKIFFKKKKLRFKMKKFIYNLFISLFDPPKINFELSRPKFFLSLVEMNLNMIIFTISWSF